MKTYDLDLYDLKTFRGIVFETLMNTVFKGPANDFCEANVKYTIMTESKRSLQEKFTCSKNSSFGLCHVKTTQTFSSCPDD